MTDNRRNHEPVLPEVAETLTPPTPQSAPSPTEIDTDQTSVGFDDDFDPAAVPRFPVLTCHLTAPETPNGIWSVDVDGLTVPGVWATTAAEAAQDAIDALAATIEQKNYRVVRVNADITEDGHTERQRLIVSAEGAVFDLDAQTDQARSTTRRHRRWIIAATAAALALILVGGITTGVILGNRTTAPVVAPPSQRPAAAAAELPGQPPAGLTSHALWSSQAELTDTTPVVQTPDRHLVAATDSALVWIDPINGTTTHTLNTGQISDGPWLGSTDGLAWIAWTSGNTLSWTSALDPTDEPHSVELPTNTDNDVIATATGLAWRTSPTRFDMLTRNGPEGRTVPADTTPVAVSTTLGLIVTDEAGHTWQVTNDAPHAPDPLPLTGPANAHPHGALWADDTWLIAGWTTPDGTAHYTWHNGADTTAEHTVTEKPNPHLHSRPLTADSTSQQAITHGPWLPVRGGALHTLDHTWTPLPEGNIAAILDNDAWITNGNNSTHITLTTNQTHTTDKPTTPTQPRIATNTWVAVIADHHLYALPRED